jgi:hypothetical protein
MWTSRWSTAERGDVIDAPAGVDDLATVFTDRGTWETVERRVLRLLA